MLYSTLLFTAAAFTGLVSAQNYSTSGALSIDVSQISTQIRTSWCLAQTNSCPEICGGRASPNTCNTTSLNYTCTCTSGASPNISAYTQTIPYFVCEQWIANCVDNHPNDLVGIEGCRSVTCGTLNASEAETTATASSSSASATTTTTASSTGTTTTSSATATSTKTSAAIAMDVAKNYGTGILAAALFGVFGLVL